MDLDEASERVPARGVPPFLSSSLLSSERLRYLQAPLMAMIVGSGLATVSLAQSPGADRRVMHVEVDQHHGNDLNALIFGPTVLNTTQRCDVPVTVPNALGNCPDNLPVYQHLTPADVLDSSGNVLLHQPWPFRTVTGAVNWLRSLPATSPGGFQHRVIPSQPLPWVSEVTGVRWEYAIIHLMPGSYRSGTAEDPHNQVYGNGEQFPIELPNHVSIQGTSALDCVFDLEGVGPAFEFGASGDSLGVHSFISQVSIYGAAAFLNEGQHPRRASAIYCDRERACSPTITDCFVFGNGVGLLLDAAVTGEPPYPVHHRVTVANCTFAWNRVGIWNGDRLSTVPTVGISRLMLVNNIFDTSPPTNLNATGHPFPSSWANTVGQMAGSTLLSNFEGVDADDLLVADPPGQTNNYRDFNAYELRIGGARLYDTGLAFTPLNLPATSPRTSVPVTPGVNISPWTRPTPQDERGVLYVRDLFHNGIPGNRFVTVPSTDFDLSPGDFRLAPAVAPGHPVAGVPIAPGDVANGGARNPLVDAGYDSLPIEWKNGEALANHPKALPLGPAQATWPFDAWTDFEDADGFANPRVVDHELYPGDGIDIGADEVDLLIVAGYRFGTRTFTRLVEDRQTGNRFIDNVYVWLLGVPDAVSGLNPSCPRPFYSGDWWASPGPSVVPQFPGPWSKTAGTYYNPRVVDIAPFLLPDLHPWHAIGFHPAWPTNPVWQDCPCSDESSAGLAALHNHALYLDPTSSIVNPPGAYPPFPLLSTATSNPGYYRWLDGIPSPFTSHYTSWGGMPGDYPPEWPWSTNPFGVPPGGTQAVSTFGGWCQNVAGALEADILSGSAWDEIKPYPGVGFPQGESMRLTAEFKRSATGMPYAIDRHSNAQTFFIWKQEP